MWQLITRYTDTKTTGIHDGTANASTILVNACETQAQNLATRLLTVYLMEFHFSTNELIHMLKSEINLGIRFIMKRIFYISAPCPNPTRKEELHVFYQWRSSCL